MRSSPDPTPVAVEVTRLHPLPSPLPTRITRLLLSLLLTQLASALPPLQPGQSIIVPFPKLSTNAIALCSALSDPIPLELDPTNPQAPYFARIALPLDTPAGRVVVFAHDPVSGFTSPNLVWVETFPLLPDATTNSKARSAQPLSPPIAIQGNLASTDQRHYLITLRQGQTYTIETIARRIGSRVDPHLRLFNPAGQPWLTLDDSPGADRDAILEFVAPTNGIHRIELTDSSPEPGPAAPFHLRIHEGPAEPHSLLPLASGWPIPPIQSNPRFTPPQGITSNSPVVPIPAHITGRFLQPGQPVTWQVPGEPGQPIHLQFHARSIGLAADLGVRVFDPDGKRIANLDSTGSEDGLLDIPFQRSGLHSIQVHELSRQAGSRSGFECDLLPGNVGFTLGIDRNQLDVPAGKGTELKLTVNRRAWNGPIRLELIDAPGFHLEPSRIEGKGRDHTVRVIASTNASPADVAGLLSRTRLLGTAETTNAPWSTTASTRNAVLNQWPNLHQSPGDWNGVLLLRRKANPAPAPPTQ